MLTLLNFLEDGTTDGAGSASNNWISIVLLVVAIVAMILLFVIPGRKQKKQAQEMMAKLAVGSIVTTIGGIVGTVVELDDKHIWLQTGLGDNVHTMQFLRQAIHSVQLPPDSPEGRAEALAEKRENNEEDEIK